MTREPDAHRDPEQIAADAIARAIDAHRGASLEVMGRAAVEFMSATELLIVPAARMQGLLALERAMAGPLGAIAAERRRQVEGEGWTTAHDDAHNHGEMAAAAACYAFVASTGKANVSAPRGCISIVSLMWPRSWVWHWWKPKDARRDLERAGALIVAELERRDRAALAEESARHG